MTMVMIPFIMMMILLLIIIIEKNKKREVSQCCGIKQYTHTEKL